MAAAVVCVLLPAGAHLDFCTPGGGSRGVRALNKRPSDGLGLGLSTNKSQGSDKRMG